MFRLASPTLAVPPVSKRVSSAENVMIYVLLGLGISLRAFHYFDNRSLWEDEVFLASSLIHMDFRQLAWEPLEYMQRAPLGFLWLQKCVVSIWNRQEMALRFIPFLSGIATLYLFTKVARHYLKSGPAFLITVALICIAPPLVYHSVEAKQYGMELLISVFALYLNIQFQHKESPSQLLILGLLGGIALWFSFSAIFIFFGIAGAVGLRDLAQKNWRMLRLHLIPFGMWAASFVVLYVLFVSRFPQEEWLQQFWRNRDAFMPLPPENLSDMSWFFCQIYALLRYPMGLTWLELDYTVDYPFALRVLARFPFVALAVGAMGLWRLWKMDKWTLLLWGMPVLLTIAASSIEMYPLKERMAVFLSPIFFLIAGKGIQQLQASRLHKTAQHFLIAFFIAAPAFNSLAQVINPDLFGDYKKSRQREAMQYLQAHYRAGDQVYVYWNNLPSYRYYEEVYGLRFHVVYGSDVRKQSTDFPTYFQNLETDFAQLRNAKRIWYLYKPYNGLKLGDIENEPKWHYHQVNAYQKVLDHMGRFGKPQTQFPSENLSTDVRVVLLEK